MSRDIPVWGIHLLLSLSLLALDFQILSNKSMGRRSGFSRMPPLVFLEEAQW